jgi:hypothetical protein
MNKFQGLLEGHNGKREHSYKDISQLIGEKGQ